MILESGKGFGLLVGRVHVVEYVIRDYESRLG